MRCVLLGLSVFLFFSASLYGPFTQIQRVTQDAEIDRLLHLVEPRWRAARTETDDLAQIDILRQLRKLPGVISAEPSPDHSSLVLQLNDPRLRHARYALWERLWTIGLCVAGLGALLGGWVRREKRRLLARLRRSHRLRRQRLGIHRQAHERGVKQLWTSWMHQAIAFSAEGLVLLDDHQTVVAANTRAQHGFRLSSVVVGMHWLEVQSSPEWIVALRQSLAFPGQRVPAPPALDYSGVSVLTLTPGATWIILRVE